MFKTATAPDIIEKVHRIILDDRRKSAREIADIVDISNDAVEKNFK